MPKIEPVLNIKDIMEIFGISQPTVYRWLAESRSGRNRFPLPINGIKRKLLWNQSDIIAFSNASSPPPVKVESAATRKKRHDAAMQMLQKQGVNIEKRQTADAP